MRISKKAVLATAFGTGAVFSGVLSGFTLIAAQLLPSSDFFYAFSDMKRSLYAISGSSAILSGFLVYQTVRTLQQKPADELLQDERKQE